MQAVNIFWFRRDLRLHDNAGLYHALKDGQPVVPIFIFDRDILDKLEDKADRRVEFILAAVKNVQEKLKAAGSSLEVYYDFPEEVFKKLLSKYEVLTVFANGDYESYAKERDESIARLLQTKGSKLQLHKDHVIFEKNEVVKGDGKPYTVFTPYSKQWKAKLKPFYYKAYPTEKFFNNFFRQKARAIPSLQSMGFKKTDGAFPSPEPDEDLLKYYHEDRDYPAKRTSRMGVHLRFGTISIRELVRKALDLNATYLNELIWREFYQMILWQFPHVVPLHHRSNSFSLLRQRMCSYSFLNAWP